MLMLVEHTHTHVKVTSNNFVLDNAGVILYKMLTVLFVDDQFFYRLPCVTYTSDYVWTVLLLLV